MDFILRTGRDFQQTILSMSLSSARQEGKQKPLLKDISGGQVHMIKTLHRMENYRCDGISLKELAETLNVTPPSCSAMVDRLVDKGLLERIQDKDDRRKIHIRLSDKMRRELDHEERMMLENAEKLIERMSGDLLDRWYEIMVEVSATIKTGCMRKGKK